MGGAEADMHWKSFYATDVFNWQRAKINGKHLHYRHIGVVESAFDSDGNDFEGRADLNISATIEMKTLLHDVDLRRRLVLAWSCFRNSYPLWACKSLFGEEFLPESAGRRWLDKYFVYEKPSNQQQCLDAADQTTTFLQDLYPEVDLRDFYTHVMNSSRAIDDKLALSQLFVLPFRKLHQGTTMLTIFIVAGHEICDGLTVFRTIDRFIDFLNLSEKSLLGLVDKICSETADPNVVFPVAQESLYPVYSTNAARNRWNWAVSHILRHVRRPPPASFQNPLRRKASLQTAVRMPEKYAGVLDYSRLPPLNSYIAGADLPKRATDNLIKLCRQARISIGSGAFVLVGIVMMRFEEARNPGVPYWERLPFVGSFPVNPRPFLDGAPTAGKEDSLMLAFSDGITLPFVPSDLDLAKTFRVLGRVAHRQLRQYQKGRRTPQQETYLGSRSPKELLPALYMSSLQRLESKSKPEHRVGLSFPQAYLAGTSPTLATCGISSVGDRANLIHSGRHDLDNQTNDLVADFRDLSSLVRARDGEFLCGAIGTKDSMTFRVSYDGCAIDPAKAEAWGKAMESILDFDMESEARQTLPPVAGLRRQPKL